MFISKADIKQFYKNRIPDTHRKCTQCAEQRHCIPQTTIAIGGKTLGPVISCDIHGTLQESRLLCICPDFKISAFEYNTREGVYASQQEYACTKCFVKHCTCYTGKE